MSISKKYYYIKIKDSFFKEESIKIIKQMPGGFEYICLLMEMYLLSSNSDGFLCYQRNEVKIPYNEDMLSSALGYSISTIVTGLSLFEKFGLIDIIDGRMIYMSDIETFIGQSSTEGDRKKKSRVEIKKKVKNDVLKITNKNNAPDICPPEIRDLDIRDLDINLSNTKVESNNPSNQANQCNQRSFDESKDMTDIRDEEQASLACLYDSNMLFDMSSEKIQNIVTVRKERKDIPYNTPKEMSDDFHAPIVKNIIETFWKKLHNATKIKNGKGFNHWRLSSEQIDQTNDVILACSDLFNYEPRWTLKPFMEKVMDLYFDTDQEYWSLNQFLKYLIRIMSVNGVLGDLDYQTFHDDFNKIDVTGFIDACNNLFE